MIFATSKHLNSFRINHLTCLFAQKTRKSNAALLLPHVLSVSPLLRYSYKKMGGTPLVPIFGQSRKLVTNHSPLNPHVDSPQGASYV